MSECSLCTQLFLYRFMLMLSFTSCRPPLVGSLVLLCCLLGAGVDIVHPQKTQPLQTEGQQPEKIFRAGAATSNITPALGEPIVGGFSPRPAKHIHDELHARCLVLDDGQTKLAIVLCDNVGIPREVFDAARKQIEEQTDLQGDHMLMAATHTHSATSARTDQRLVVSEHLNEYQQFLARRIAEGVRRAHHNLQPARIAWYRAEEPGEVFNRRWVMSAGAHLQNPFGGMDQVRMNPPRGHEGLIRPAGPTDPEIAFVSVQSREGRPIALLANYSLHYVGGTGPDEISADYFALFADRVQQLLEADRLDPPFVGMMSNGTSGDVNNIDFRGPAPRHKPYEKMRDVAHKVAGAVYEAHQHLKFNDWVPLAAVRQDLELDVRKPTSQQLAAARALLDRPEGAPHMHHVYERAYARRLLLLDEAPKQVSVPLQALRIGDLGIAAIPFEVFVETGLDIKEKSPFKQSFTISLANGSYGYLPTPRHHVLGGYETWQGTNLVEVEASTKITQALLEHLKSLAAEPVQ